MATVKMAISLQKPFGEQIQMTKRVWVMAKSVLGGQHKFVFPFLIVLVIVVGCLRVYSTYHVFWQTWDEPFHIAAGMEWLDKGQFTYEPLHPPLARVMSALGLYLSGVRGVDAVKTSFQVWQEGNIILHTGGKYEQNLTLARIGIMPFFIIASLVVALWAKKCGGIATSLLATCLFTTLPPILAHAGVATLDMANAAFMAATLFTFGLWLSKPTLTCSCLLGISVGLAILSKLSALGFLLIIGSLIVALCNFNPFRKRFVEDGKFPKFKEWMPALVIALLLCFLTIWAGYRFSFSTLASPESRPHDKVDWVVGTDGLLHEAAYLLIENVPVPAPELIKGVYDFRGRNQKGHLAYLLGDIKKQGWWYFFPVVFLLKTPLPFTMLSVIGIFFIFKTGLAVHKKRLYLLIPVIAATGIMTIGMLGSVNNGLRQILGIYPLLAVVAGYGGVKLLSWNTRSQWMQLGVVTGLLFWQLTSSFAAHPDYLAYFNELVGDQPEKIAVDSDLDWGQDLRRLALTLKKRGVNEFAIKYNGSKGVNLEWFDFPPNQELKAYQRETGWIAISVFRLTLGTGDAPFDQFSWLKEYEPVERIGKSILLYYIPER